MKNLMSSKHCVQLSVESQDDFSLASADLWASWAVLVCSAALVRALFPPQTPNFASLMVWVANEGHKGSKDFRSTLGFPM